LARPSPRGAALDQQWIFGCPLDRSLEPGSAGAAHELDGVLERPGGDADVDRRVHQLRAGPVHLRPFEHAVVGNRHPGGRVQPYLKTTTNPQLKEQLSPVASAET
jgi:hypothetical protein